MRRRSLVAFIARRLLALVLLLLLISFLIFALLYLAPGSPIDALVGTQQPSPELVSSLRAKFHLDDPFLQQYWLWLRDAVTLDLGDSVRTGQPVAETITGRLGATLFLGVYAFVLTAGIGVLLGTLAALRKRSVIDRTVVAASVVGVSTPVFVAGVVLLYLFAVELPWFPAYGAGEGFADRLWHLTLPAIALAMVAIALVVKITRTAMVDALDQDYVAFARARGVPLRRVITHHAMRNALIPIITVCGLVLTFVLTGAVLVEVTFSLPGVGALLVDAVHNKDVPTVQGIAMVTATVVILVNLLVDVLYVLVDPRIQFRKVRA